MLKSKKILIGAAFGFLLIYFIYKNITVSVFFKGEERVNIVFYGQDTIYYSLSTNNISYLVPFSADVEVLIPGGYGYYKLGALGKLVALEKKPDLFKRTFSVNTSSFVDLYFYDAKPIIYYETNKKFNKFPNFAQIFLSRSNATLFDKIYLYYSFIQKQKIQFKLLADLPLIKEKKQLIFDREEFFKKYQGRFYKKSYRTENRIVQIMYTKSYKTALMLSRMIDGEGIRVADISKALENQKRECSVIHKHSEISQAAKKLASFFNCSLKKGKTDISDIIFDVEGLNEWNID